MKTSLIFLLLVFTNVLFAQISPSITVNPSPTLRCSDPLKGTTLLYINGQENEQRDIEAAITNFETLLNSSQLNLKPKLDKNSKVHLDYVFNPTQGFAGSDKIALADFVESAALILQSEFGYSRIKAWSAAYSAFVIGIEVLAIRDLILEKDFVIDNRLVEAIQVPFLTLLLAETEITDELKTAIKQHLFGFGEKLIMISHSQGNLFVNTAVDELRGTSSTIGSKTYEFDKYIKFLGNAQIATPAGYFEVPKSNYIKNHLDAINKVFTGVPSNFTEAGSYIPPDNINYPDYDHINNHGLLDAYLYGQGNSHSIGLTQQTIQNWVDVAGMLESNCNIPPVSIFHYYPDINPVRDPYKYIFDGRESYADDDPNNHDLTYRWTFNDIEIGTEPILKWRFHGDRTNITVGLEVTAKNELKHKSEQRIDVQDYPPFADFSYQVNDLEVSFNAVGSVDSDGVIDSYFWDFGDGSVGYGMMPVHTYFTNRLYRVTLTVTDNNGKSTITVRDVPTGVFKAVASGGTRFNPAGFNEIWLSTNQSTGTWSRSQWEWISNPTYHFLANTENVNVPTEYCDPGLRDGTIVTWRETFKLTLSGYNGIGNSTDQISFDVNWTIRCNPPFPAWYKMPWLWTPTY